LRKSKKCVTLKFKRFGEAVFKLKDGKHLNVEEVFFNSVEGMSYTLDRWSLSVTENLGIKPRNTNVVLKGRHSLLQPWMHGG